MFEIKIVEIDDETTTVSGSIKPGPFRNEFVRKALYEGHLLEKIDYIHVIYVGGRLRGTMVFEKKIPVLGDPNVDETALFFFYAI